MTPTYSKKLPKLSRRRLSDDHKNQPRWYKSLFLFLFLAVQSSLPQTLDSILRYHTPIVVFVTVHDVVPKGTGTSRWGQRPTTFENCISTCEWPSANLHLKYVKQFVLKCLECCWGAAAFMIPGWSSLQLYRHRGDARHGLWKMKIAKLNRHPYIKSVGNNEAWILVRVDNLCRRLVVTIANI